MRSTFNAIPTSDVTLERPDGQEVTLTLHALPVGYQAMVRVEMPEPQLFRNGKPLGADGTKEHLYWHRFSLILIAKALEPGGEIEAKRDTFKRGSGDQTRIGWEVYADAIEKEFIDAHFTQAEVQIIADAVSKVGQRVARPDSGNFATPEEG